METPQIEFNEEYYYRLWCDLLRLNAEWVDTASPGTDEDAGRALQELRKGLLDSLRTWRRNYLNSYGVRVPPRHRLNHRVVLGDLPPEPCRPRTFEASGGGGWVNEAIITNYLSACGALAVFLKTWRERQTESARGVLLHEIRRRIARFQSVSMVATVWLSMRHREVEPRATWVLGTWALVRLHQQKRRVLLEAIFRGSGRSLRGTLDEFEPEVLIAASNITSLDDLFARFATVPDQAANEAIRTHERDGETLGRTSAENRRPYESLDAPSDKTGRSRFERTEDPKDPFAVLFAQLDDESHLNRLLGGAGLTPIQRELWDLFFDDPSLLDYGATPRLAARLGSTETAAKKRKSELFAKMRRAADESG